jgi:TonB family protein
LPSIVAARTLRLKRRRNDRRMIGRRIMAHAIGVRATSFAASAALLGFAVLAALTMTIVQHVADIPDGLPYATIVEPPPPPEPRPRQPEPPPPTDPISGVTIAPIPAPLSQPSTQLAALTAPTDFIPTVVNPQWVRQPRDLARYYPERALRREVEGRVVLDCGVSIRGALDCAVVSETPANWGFGEAALRISRDYQMVPAMRGGVPVEARHRMVVPFEIR